MGEPRELGTNHQVDATASDVQALPPTPLPPYPSDELPIPALTGSITYLSLLYQSSGQ